MNFIANEEGKLKSLKEKWAPAGGGFWSHFGEITPKSDFIQGPKCQGCNLQHFIVLYIWSFFVCTFSEIDKLINLVLMGV